MISKCEFCGSRGKHLEPCYESLDAKIKDLKGLIRGAVVLISGEECLCFPESKCVRCVWLDSASARCP